jgi:RNA polymerase sigma-70 factor (ECF subfamily)
MEGPPESSKTHEMSSATLDVGALTGMVREAQGGSIPAAEKLIREHDGWVRSVVYGVAGRADLVDDIVQQVWTQAWERLDTLQDPARLRSWLYTIARNAAIDAGQARKRRSGVALEAIGEAAAIDTQPGPVKTAVGAELKSTLLRAIEGLPAIYREPFVLRHLEDWSYAQIGALLSLPLETVETRLVRARRLLREALKGKLD